MHDKRLANLYAQVKEGELYQVCQELDRVYCSGLSALKITLAQGPDDSTQQDLEQILLEDSTPEQDLLFRPFSPRHHPYEENIRKNQVKVLVLQDPGQRISALQRHLQEEKSIRYADRQGQVTKSL